MNDIGGKIRELRSRLGWTTEKMGAYIGVNQSTVSKYESGKQVPKSEATARLAELAEVSVDEWLGNVTESTRAVRGRTAPVVGDVQAGVWKKTVEWPESEQYPVTVMIDPRSPNYPLRVFITRGPSMNKNYPEGSQVYVASIEDVKPKTGNHVLTVRRNARGLSEVTIKEYIENEDGTVWLWPKSTDPEYQAPVRLDENISIEGVVRAALISGPGAD